jgi:hypothetical protein
LIYEKRVSNLRGLTRELQTLDGDAGVRVEGVFEGKRCFGFVTRFEDTFTIVVCRAVGKSLSIPGERLAARDFRSVGETVSFIRELSGSRPKAFVY